MQHDHKKESNTDKPTDNDDNKTDIKDPQLDKELEIIDQYTYDKGKKRKKDPEEDSDNDTRKRRIPNNGKDDITVVDNFSTDDEATNDDLKVIDEYNNDDDDDDDGQDDPNLKIIDEVFDETPNNLKVKKVDPSSHKKLLYYQKLYENCKRSYKNQKFKFQKTVDALQKRNRNVKLNAEDTIEKIKKQHKREMKDLEELKENLCEEKLNKVKQECDDKLGDIEKEHKKILIDMESECEDKIKKLNSHIKSMEDNDESVNDLTKAIFNCTSMEEIFEIQRLIKNHQLDVVIQRHLKTLQNLFLSLSYGILPICQPQRSKVTDTQRKLVEKIQSSSGSAAKKLIKENKDSITNLFMIIDDSLKLARNSYNRYGTNL